MKRLRFLGIVCISAVILFAILWFKSEHSHPDTHPYMTQLCAKPVSVITTTSYPEYWDYAEYPYRDQPAPDKYLKVHGILKFHNIPNKIDEIVAGKEIGETRLVSGGPYKWCGPINNSKAVERTGWQKIWLEY